MQSLISVRGVVLYCKCRVKFQCEELHCTVSAGLNFSARSSIVSAGLNLSARSSIVSAGFHFFA